MNNALQPFAFMREVFGSRRKKMALALQWMAERQSLPALANAQQVFLEN